MSNTVSAIRINLYDCVKAPRDYIREVAPSNAVRSAWVPQTMGEQIWLLYEFRTQEDREAWEKGLPAEVSRWIDRRLIEHARGYESFWRNERNSPEADK